MPPYPSAFALAVLVLCAAESILVRGTLSFAYAVYLVALALPVGALLGFAVQLILALGVRISTLHRSFSPLSFWSVLGIGSGVGLAAGLNAFTRLDTHYDKVARYTIGASIAGGLLLALLIAALQPTFWAQRGALAEIIN